MQKYPITEDIRSKNWYIITPDMARIWKFSILLLVICRAGTITNWNKVAKDTLKAALARKQNTRVAKNIIIFLGDGMGISTINAARIRKGQKMGNTGEETVLEFEKFSNVALSKVYGADRQVPDSAQTATAFLCGEKTNWGVIGLRETVPPSDCSAQVREGASAKLTSIIRHAIAEGKSTGIVTNTRVTHATPASAYAHSAQRDWESDSDLNTTDNGACKDIAHQLIHDNSDIQVILGGGRRAFLPENQPDGTRLDGQNLTDVWESMMSSKGRSYKYVWRKKEFDEIDVNNVDYVLGLFNPSHMDYEIDRNSSSYGEPSLTEMVSKAVKILRRNTDNGFVLLVEGGRIDHGHHDSFAKRALEETIQLESAVKEAVSLISTDDTLFIVTADHSHPFSLAGYTTRGRDILGLVDPIEAAKTLDKKPYTSLLYADGPGWSAVRQNLTGVSTDDKEYRQQSAVPREYESHSGEDVAIFAQGPMAHLFHGVHEQHYISHVMQYSACLGDYKSSCDRESRPYTSAMSAVSYCVYLMSFILCMHILS